tara:strand:- start:763 stop:1512 length:750 start_codon:yes stop_codon:yes gene_type:complete
MSSIRIIPSLLLKDRRLVKGKEFKNHIDCGDPVKTCVSYEGQLADEIILVDLLAYTHSKKPNFDILKSINNECNTPIAFGGNISSENDFEKCIRNGADKIIINNHLENKELINNLVKNFGSQSIIAGIDIIKINNNFKILKRDKILELDIYSYIEKVTELEVGEIKITYVHLEGTGKGFEQDLSAKIINKTNLPVIFEGGFDKLHELDEAINKNLSAIALGNMITFSDNNIFKIKQYLENCGHKVRLRN